MISIKGISIATRRCFGWNRHVARPLVLLLVLLSTISGSVKAQVSDVSYTFSPMAERIYWSEDAGLKDANLYGGAIGFGFGEFVQLNGLYLFGNDLKTDFSRFNSPDSTFLSGLQNVGIKDVQMKRFGGALRFNLARGSFVPFVTIGTGLLRFEPDALEKVESIYLSAGLGFTFSLADRYNLFVQAENLSYRYNPAGFFSADDLQMLGDLPEGFGQATINNWGITGGVSFFVGGRRPGSLTDIDREFQRQFSSGLKGLSITAEPFIGQINFDESLGFRDQQSVAGVGASIDFGSYLGLRGFYWRGLDGSNADDIQFYGGEMQFNLSSGEGVVPYLLLGGGYVDVLDGYVGAAGMTPNDKPFAIGGGGLVFPISPRVKLHAGVRSMLMSGEEIENISNPNQVKSSLMYTGGLKFAVGGRRGDAPDVLRRQTMEEEIARLQLAAAAREAELNNALVASQTKSDSLATAILIADARGDSLASAKLRIEQAREQETEARLEEAAKTANTAAQGAVAPVAVAPAAQPVRTADGDRIVTLPLPEEGELYIRFGAPGGVNIESTFEGTNAPAPVQQLSPATGSQQPPLTNEQIRAIMSETLQDAMREQQSALDRERAAIQVQIDQATERAEKERLEERLRLLEQQANRPRETGEVRTTQPAGNTSGLDAAELERVERRMEQRLDDRFDLLMAEIRGLRTVQNQVAAPAPVVVVQPGEDGNMEAVIEQSTTNPADARSGGYQFNHLRPYAGFNISGDPSQFLLGIRGEWQRKFSPSKVRFVPEVVLGFGDGATMVNPNLYLTVPVLNLQNAYPYVGAGLGLIGFLSAPDGTDSVEATLNLLIGTELNVGAGRLFVEYANVDLSTYNRIGVGYRMDF